MKLILRMILTAVILISVGWSVNKIGEVLTEHDRKSFDEKYKKVSDGNGQWHWEEKSK